MVDVGQLNLNVWSKLQLINESSQIKLVGGNVTLLLDKHAIEEFC